MTKLRKQRRKKVFRHNVNRKRLRNKIESVGNIECKEIKAAWESRKTVGTNLLEMGLSYDPNKTIKIPNSKKRAVASLVSNRDEWKVEKIQNIRNLNHEKANIVKAMEYDAKAPRERKFRLPKSQVEWVTYLMKKHGRDFKAMAADKKNYNQETWKQIRQKIRRFKSIPEQYNKYLHEHGLVKSDSEDCFLSDDEL